VFAKAVGLDRNPASPAMHRKEAAVAARLPDSPATPKLLWSYDDGDWVALVFEDIDGRNPALPWKPDEFQRVHDAMVLLSEVDGNTLLHGDARADNILLTDDRVVVVDWP
jgi:Ser/Thr protein kinase RdoA (MazF antagonist)